MNVPRPCPVVDMLTCVPYIAGLLRLPGEERTVDLTMVDSEMTIVDTANVVDRALVVVCIIWTFTTPKGKVGFNMPAC